MTLTDNYAWFPQRKERLILDFALFDIFVYKGLFWLLITNLIVFALIAFIKKKERTSLIAFTLTVVLYFVAGYVVDKSCASAYYRIFMNQSVSEEYITRPLLEGGYQVGYIVMENLPEKEMKNRRYAIGAIGELKFKPAIPILQQILSDKTELDVFRADAFEALQKIGTMQSKEIAEGFRKHATDSLDLNVIKLADY